MDSAVDSASYPQLLIVLVVAEWLYLDWAESRDGHPSRQVHRGWIDLHRGEAFRGWVQFLVDELERVFSPAAETTSESRSETSAKSESLARVWQQAVDLECQFFDAVYERAAAQPE